MNLGKQDKHIVGTNNYNLSLKNGVKRSILKENPQNLLDEHAGLGTFITENKEWVDFGKVIGQYYDINTGTYVNTTKGIIHYDSKGSVHIVPANPKGMR
ncbi:MAG: transposase [Clostridia bacterium]|nr:transposase [Clostridia bacterium]